MSRQPASLFADDLTRIKGIGHTFQSRLYEAGVHTYEDLAALSPAQIVALLGQVPGLTVKRVTIEDWPGQAQAFALTLPGQAVDETRPQDSEEPSLIDHPHYATFTLELLLDDENNVDRTRVTHAQSGREESPWAGWDAKRLLDFIIQCAGIRASTPLLSTPAFTNEPTSEHAEEVANVDVATSTSTPEGITRLSGELRVREFTPVLMRSQQRADAGLQIQVDLDFTQLSFPAHAPLAYEATLYARSTLRRGYTTLGQTKGTLKPGEPPTILVPCHPLDVGVYRLDGMVTVNLPASPPTSGTMVQAYLENRLLQVY